MKIKNISRGIISIGAKNLIPGTDAVEVTAAEAKLPAIVRAMAKGKLIAVEEKVATKAATKAK